MKTLVKVAHRRAAIGDVFRQNQLFTLQFSDLAFIRADDGRAVRIDDAIKKLVHLFLYGDLFQLERRAAFRGFLGVTVPQIAEPDGYELNEFVRGRERADKGFQRVFDLGTGHGLTIADASALAAHVVGIATARARSPSGGHGMVAIAAREDTAHREVRVDILTGRGVGLTRQALLNDLKCSERNQPFVLRLSERNIPARHR